MPKSDARAKADRLYQIQKLFEQPGQRLGTSELAEKLGVDDETIRRDIKELSRTGRLPLDKKGQKWVLMEDGRIPQLKVHLNLSEATALYIAGRLLTQIHDERNRFVITGLIKLIEALPESLHPHQHILIEMAEQRQHNQPDRSNVFEALTMGWATHHWVRLRYAPAHKKKFDCHFSPYLLEPSGIGRTVYAIGMSDLATELRTFKLERIEWAELTDQPFTIDDSFDGPNLLKRAWGVMYGASDEDLVTVRLRFSQYVTPRVKETLWHPSQQLKMTRDGCELTMQIADTLEAENWIRGWGADCEVLEPADLRESMISHIRRLTKSYGLTERGPHNPAEFDMNLFKKGE